MFEIGAIVSMTIVILVIMVETTADILAVGDDHRHEGDPAPRRRRPAGRHGSPRALAPVFNSFPATAFAQNVGLVALTGYQEPLRRGGRRR